MRKLKVISTVTSLLVSTMFFSNVSAMADLGVSTGNFVEDGKCRCIRNRLRSYTAGCTFNSEISAETCFRTSRVTYN